MLENLIAKENFAKINCLLDSQKLFTKKYIGKVRDTYDLGDYLLIATTDRLSAFDRQITAIPFKGEVLNRLSAWWFGKTQHIIGNHFVKLLNANMALVKKCKVFPVEVVVRGFLTGSTNTSIWVNYANGQRNFCGTLLPDGLEKNCALNHAIITPTTKSDVHDAPITAGEIIDNNLMTQNEWNFISGKALELFIFGQNVARGRGLILVDTKYEFGKDKDGNILLVDEMHTPDSSRYWDARTCADLIAKGKEPDNFDKEVVRLWLKDNFDPYGTDVIPQIPLELVMKTSNLYKKIYHVLTD